VASESSGDGWGFFVTKPVPPQGGKKQDVTDAELNVLQILWDEGPVTIRQLADVLYPNDGDAGYATVQILLKRLEAKNHVHRDRRSHAHLFSALTDRDTLVGRRLRRMAEKLCGGLMGSLLTHLVRAEELSAIERQELRALMDELDRKDHHGGGPSGERSRR
jgi:BlaI family transcriptional regulator, penicillinase repressor